MSVINSPKFYLYGWVYDMFINLFLKGVRKKISDYIISSNLYPVLDVCCGTGKQCASLNINEYIVLGFDLDFKMMAYASFKYSNIPFICADAYYMPFKPQTVKSIIISFSLHDKTHELRHKMLTETMKLLASNGRIIFIDFVPPWNLPSRIGYNLVYMVEKMAGREHFKNGRKFLHAGGLERFLKCYGLKKILTYNLKLLCSRLIIAEI